MGDDRQTLTRLTDELARLQHRVAELQAVVDRAGNAEALAAEQQRYAEAVIETVRDPILVLDAAMTVLSVNPAFYRTFSEEPSTTIGRQIYALGNGQWDIAQLRTMLEEILPGRRRVEDFEVSHHFETIGHKIMQLTARQIYQDSIGTRTILLTIEDVTLRRQLEERLRVASITDELTGLYDRRGLFTLGEKLLQLASRQRQGIWALYIDLDGLKRINDTWGHEEGDRALLETAQILRDTYRESDIIARIGGDEFVVLSLSSDTDSAAAALSRLPLAVAARREASSRRFELSLSAGMAVCPAGSCCSISDLLRQGDESMYGAKRARHEPARDSRGAPGAQGQ